MRDSCGLVNKVREKIEMISDTVNSRKINLMRRAFLAAVVSVVLVSSAASGSDYLQGTDRILTIRPLGMGGGGNASAASTSALYTNPAGMMVLRLYHVELMYQYGSEMSSHLGGAAVVDSVTSPYVGAGLGFAYKGTASSPTDHDQFDVRLGIAGAFTDWFMVGVNGKYMHATHGGLGPSGRPALGSSGDAVLNTFSMDAGLLLRPVKFIGVGIAGYNLTNTGSAFAPIELAPAVAFFVADMFTGEFEFIVDFTSHSEEAFEYHAGLELFLADVVPLRAGYFFKDWDESHNVTAGIGYVSRQFGIEFGLSQRVTGPKDTTAGLGVRIFVN